MQQPKAGHTPLGEGGEGATIRKQKNKNVQPHITDKTDITGRGENIGVGQNFKNGQNAETPPTCFFRAYVWYVRYAVLVCPGMSDFFWTRTCVRFDQLNVQRFVPLCPI